MELQVPSVEERLDRESIPWRGVVVCAAGLLYPQWQRLAPVPANDPTWIWWSVGMLLAAAGLISVLRPRLDGVGDLAVSAVTYLVTIQLFALAVVNDMHPFYALGSSMTVMATALYSRTPSRLVAYTGFVTLLATALFIRDPDQRMLAYWGGPFPLLALAIYRLHSQARDERLKQHYTAELQAQVVARTQDLLLANRRLERESLERARLEHEMRVAQKMEAVGRVTGGIAHEFNNLITTIGIYAELIDAAMPEDSPQRRDVAQISESANEAAGLVQSLLAVSKPGSGETEILDLCEVVSNMEDLIRHVLGRESQLVLRLGDGPCRSRANLEETRQILLNLVLNSRDAMPRGGELTIEVYEARAELGLGMVEEKAERSDFVVLAVSDTGVGMDADTLARASEPFFTTKDTNRGTGLGLSTVYGTVTQRGGHARVDSTPGEGTRFELYLPRAGEQTSIARTAEALRTAKQGVERILLVEDEADLRHALQRVLQNSGYEVADASDGEAALARIQSPDERFDLVISDVVMPRMNGIELAERLASMRPRTRVLLLSGYTSHPALRNRAIPKDAAFLAKPFSHADLLAKVRESLDAPLN